MGGVDRADKLRSYYYIGRQSRKWYKYLFWFAFNLAACNAYNLEYENCERNKRRPQDAFRIELGKRLIGNSIHGNVQQTLALCSFLSLHQRTNALKSMGVKRSVLIARLKGKRLPKTTQWRPSSSVNNAVLRFAKIHVSGTTTLKCERSSDITLEHFNLSNHELAKAGNLI